MNSGKTANIPSEQECLRIMAEQDMLPNIVSHSIQVKRVALAIVDNLLEGTAINRELVMAASLLHDIAKSRTIRTGEIRHDLIGADMAREMGFPEIGEIIACHVMMNDFDPQTGLEEREIVFYADKRVMHDQIVTLEDRITDISRRYERYVSDPVIIEKSRRFALAVERKIAHHLRLPMEDIIARL